MADNSGNTPGLTGEYRSPQVKIVLVKTQGLLCQSPTVSGWTGGSKTDDIDMGD